MGLAGIFHTQLDQTDFTEDTEPKPQSSQSGQGVWLRDLGAKLGALREKECVQESVIDAGYVRMRGRRPAVISRSERSIRA